MCVFNAPELDLRRICQFRFRTLLYTWSDVQAMRLGCMREYPKTGISVTLCPRSITTLALVLSFMLQWLVLAQWVDQKVVSLCCFCIDFLQNKLSIHRDKSASTRCCQILFSVSAPNYAGLLYYGIRIPCAFGSRKETIRYLLTSYFFLFGLWNGMGWSVTTSFFIS